MGPQLLLNGFIAGCTYGLIALGFSLIYGVGRFFHFAHGAAITCGAYFVLLLTEDLRCPLLIAVVISVLLTAVLGAVMEASVYRPLRRRDGTAVAFLVTSLGLYVVLQNLLSLVFGDDAHTLLTGADGKGLGILGARITPAQIGILVVTVGLYVTVSWFLSGTAHGRRIRAVSSNEELARAVGIDRDHEMLVVLVLGSALAAAAGILMALDTDMTPTMGFRAVLVGAVACVVGGLGNLPASFAGGLFLGLVENLSAWLLPTQWKDPLVFVILLAFLAFRPQGFFGTPLRSAEV